MRDARRQERVPLRARVWCEDEEVTLYVSAVDASDGGVRVRTAKHFERGREVRLGFSGPEGEAVATARVAWSSVDGGETPAMGLELTDFARGREVFDAMVRRARRRRDRISSPVPFDPRSLPSVTEGGGPEGSEAP